MTLTTGPSTEQSEKEILQSIGKKLRLLRAVKGLNQSVLANLLGITFQQYQKYEAGKNRISISNLLILLRFFDVSFDDFFKSEKDLTLLMLQRI